MKLNLKAPHQTYRCKDGEKVSGVTTVLNELNKAAIPYWTGCEERSGILRHMGANLWTADMLRVDLPVNGKTGKPLLFADAMRDRAADVGTVAHAMIEAWHWGDTLDPDGIDPVMYAQAVPAFERFKESWLGIGLTLVHAELQMVSEEWRVGGTLDQIGRAKDGSLELWDTKTSKPWFNGRPYPENMAQVMAYAGMYAEVCGEAVSRVRIARIGKTAGDPGDLYTLSDGERGIGTERWLAARWAHETTLALKKLWKEDGR